MSLKDDDRKVERWALRNLYIDFIEKKMTFDIFKTVEKQKTSFLNSLLGKHVVLMASYKARRFS